MKQTIFNIFKFLYRLDKLNEKYEIELFELENADHFKISLCFGCSFTLENNIIVYEYRFMLQENIKRSVSNNLVLMNWTWLCLAKWKMHTIEKNVNVIIISKPLNIQIFSWIFTHPLQSYKNQPIMSPFIVNQENWHNNLRPFHFDNVQKVLEMYVIIM